LTFVSAQELSGLGYKKGKPLGLVGVTELSEDQKRQLKEQQEVQSDKCDAAAFQFPILSSQNVLFSSLLVVFWFVLFFYIKIEMFFRL